MLFSKAIMRAVAAEFDRCKSLPPLVVDPVMVASSGDPLLKKSAVAAYEDLLFPRAVLVTPNLDELRVLSRMPCNNPDEIREAGAALVARHGCAFLLKGGHLDARLAVDILATPGGFREFSAPFRRGVGTHGTGCTLSAAIATGLAFGLDLPGAVARAKDFISRAIGGSFHWGKTSALAACRAGGEPWKRGGCQAVSEMGDRPEDFS